MDHIFGNDNPDYETLPEIVVTGRKLDGKFKVNEEVLKKIKEGKGNNILDTDPKKILKDEYYDKKK